MHTSRSNNDRSMNNDMLRTDYDVRCSSLNAFASEELIGNSSAVTYNQ
jgi:hypothetical protein